MLLDIKSTVNRPPVRGIEEDLREVLQEVAFREFGREIHACPYRRFSAHAIM